MVGIVGFKFTRGKTGSTGSAGGSASYSSASISTTPKKDDDASSSENENKGASSASNVISGSNTQMPLPQTQTTQQQPLTQQERAERFRRLVSTFQQKGATSPEKAMTAEQLGLPPRFEDFMERRAGQTKVFQEVNGKYYLDQKALAEVRKQWANRNP